MRRQCLYEKLAALTHRRSRSSLRPNEWYHDDPRRGPPKRDARLSWLFPSKPHLQAMVATVPPALAPPPVQAPPAAAQGPAAPVAAAPTAAPARVGAAPGAAGGAGPGAAGGGNPFLNLSNHALARLARQAINAAVPPGARALAIAAAIPGPPGAQAPAGECQHLHRLHN
jgi:hypothetical protein